MPASASLVASVFSPSSRSSWSTACMRSARCSWRCLMRSSDSRALARREPLLPMLSEIDWVALNAFGGLGDGDFHFVFADFRFRGLDQLLQLAHLGGERRGLRLALLFEFLFERRHFAELPRPALPGISPELPAPGLRSRATSSSRRLTARLLVSLAITSARLLRASRILLGVDDFLLVDTRGVGDDILGTSSRALPRNRVTTFLITDMFVSFSAEIRTGRPVHQARCRSGQRRPGRCLRCGRRAPGHRIARSGRQYGRTKESGTDGLRSSSVSSSSVRRSGKTSLSFHR